jgi:cytochrome P450
MDINMVLEKSPPGPQGDFILGNLTDFTEDPLSFLTLCSREYGGIVSLRFGPFSTYLLNHPDLIDYVLKNTNQKFIKSKVLKSNKLILGEGLLTSEGEFWQRQRRLTQPAFVHKRIIAYADTMVEYTNRMLMTWQDGEIRDIHQDMMQLTMEIVAKCLFNADVVGEAEEVGKNLTISLEHFNLRAKTMFLLPDNIPTLENTRFQRTVSQLNEVVYGIINQRRNSGEDTGDLLSILMQAEDEDGTKMTDQQLRDEVMTLFLAGHETTANTLSWIWMLLSQNPEVEEKLLKELQTVLGDANPQASTQASLPYTERVVIEAMRLYPPVWRMSRELAEDWEVNGYLLKSGSNVFMSQWVMHRDPRYFDNPEEFNPERWANDFAKTLPPGVYFPFGAGPRGCIGQGFAIIEAVVLLAMIAQKFQISLIPEYSIELQPSITLRPKNGIKVKITKRD